MIEGRRPLYYIPSFEASQLLLLTTNNEALFEHIRLLELRGVHLVDLKLLAQYERVHDPGLIKCDIFVHRLPADLWSHIHSPFFPHFSSLFSQKKHI